MIRLFALWLALSTVGCFLPTSPQVSVDPSDGNSFLVDGESAPIVLLDPGGWIVQRSQGLLRVTQTDCSETACNYVGMPLTSEENEEIIQYGEKR